MSVRPSSSDWQEVSGPGGRWRVRPEWRTELLGEDGRKLLDRLAGAPNDTTHIVKQASHRTVYLLETALGNVFVKHYPVADLRSWLRTWLRPPKAVTECDKALSLAERGIPTVDPVAIGMAAHGASYLVTQAVEDAEPLDQHLRQHLSTEDIPWQRQMTQELAAFVARLHDAGVTHQDFHPGNILLQTDEFGLPQLTLIDPYEVRLGPPLNLQESLANLALFGLWFLPRTSPTDRLRFWRYYWLERQELSLEVAAAERELLPQLGAALWQLHLQRWRQREHRYLGDNREFYRLRHAGNRAWAVREIPPELLKQLLTSPDAPFTWPTSRLLKDSPSSTVAELLLPTTTGEKVVIYKRFLVTKRTDPFLNLFRDSPALKSWRNGQRLLEVGLPTARPLAVLHRRRFGLTWESYLVTEKLTDAIELKTYVQQLAALPQAQAHQRRQEITATVARLVRRLHQHQVSHRDLKAANILVVNQNEEGKEKSPQLYLIDLYGMRRWRKLPRAQRLQNLMRLYVSFQEEPWLTPAHCLRFLKIYLQAEPEEAGRWKHWWREIAALAAKKVAQNQRRQRPLS